MCAQQSNTTLNLPHLIPHTHPNVPQKSRAAPEDFFVEDDSFAAPPPPPPASLRNPPMSRRPSLACTRKDFKHQINYHAVLCEQVISDLCGVFSTGLQQTGQSRETKEFYCYWASLPALLIMTSHETSTLP